MYIIVLGTITNGMKDLEINGLYYRHSLMAVLMSSTLTEVIWWFEFLEEMWLLLIRIWHRTRENPPAALHRGHRCPTQRRQQQQLFPRCTRCERCKRPLHHRLRSLHLATAACPDNSRSKFQGRAMGRVRRATQGGNFRRHAKGTVAACRSVIRGETCERGVEK